MIYKVPKIDLNIKWTNNNNISKQKQNHQLGTVSNKLQGEEGWGALKLGFLAQDSVVFHTTCNLLDLFTRLVTHQGNKNATHA